MSSTPDMTRIVPELSVRRGRAAIEFYKAAFGAVEDYRVGGTDDHEEVVAQLSVGDATFWVADESPAHHNFSPESIGGATARILLIVDDPAAVVERAVAAGATEVDPVGNEHGWRLGRIRDPFGHHWEVGRPLGVWPPEQPWAERRLGALYDAFNARDADAALAAMVEDVDWPNVWEGGRVRGREAVRGYWARQWAEVDPHVEPEAIVPLPDGRVAVEVRQTVRDFEGRVVVEGHVRHIYELRGGLVARMDVEEPAAGG
jgi:PhnB protein